MGSTNHSVWNLGVETYLVEDESPEELEDLRVPDSPGVAGGVGPRLGQAALDGGRRGRGDEAAEVPPEARVHRDQLVGAHPALRVAVVEEEHLARQDGNLSSTTTKICYCLLYIYTISGERSCVCSGRYLFPIGVYQG